MLEFIKLLTFASVLIYSSIIDIKTHLVPPLIYIALMMIGLINISLSSFVGLVAFFPLFIVSIISNGGIGGGDIKVAGLCGFILQGINGLFAIFIGLILAIIIVPIIHKLQRKQINVPFALIPYLSAGCIITNIIMII